MNQSRRQHRGGAAANTDGRSGAAGSRDGRTSPRSRIHVVVVLSRRAVYAVLKAKRVAGSGLSAEEEEALCRRTPAICALSETLAGARIELSLASKQEEKVANPLVPCANAAGELRRGRG